MEEEIQNEIDRVKLDLSAAHDEGDKYHYVVLNNPSGKQLLWTSTQINEILRRLSNVNAKLLSHSEVYVYLYGRRITLLFELIYN
jgi:hypothetical protein